MSEPASGVVGVHEDHPVRSHLRQAPDGQGHTLPGPGDGHEAVERPPRQGRDGAFAPSPARPRRARVRPAIAGEDRDALLRVARYSARAPVPESGLRYDADRAEVELVSDRSDGPFAGSHRFSALEFIARWVGHVPGRYEMLVRYYGAYAIWRRVWWQRRGILLVSLPAAEVDARDRADQASPTRGGGRPGD